MTQPLQPKDDDLVMLMNFDNPAPTTSVQQPAQQPPAEQVAPQIVQTVAVTVIPSESKGHLLRTVENWTWQDLQDYVVSSIEQLFGAFPRNQHKEMGIFKSFASRYGEDAGNIARWAFEIGGGYWGGAPISVNRFCKGSDQYFSDQILTRLRESGQARA